MSSFKLVLTSSAALLLGACLGGTSFGVDTQGLEGCAVGAAGCVCTQGGGCDPGLECLDGTCISPTCGDGIVQGAEQCDDANGENTDACTNACVLNVCGDGVINLAIEECDLGPANADDGVCKTDCTAQTCGDGVQGAGEACDHGAANGLDGMCAADCTLVDMGTTGGAGTSGGSTGGPGSTSGASGSSTGPGTSGGSSSGGSSGSTGGGGPTFEQVAVVADAFIDDKRPDETLGTGATLDLSDKDAFRILVQFDQATIDGLAAGKMLLSATLSVPVQAFDPSWVGPETIDVHRGAVAWTEAGANWVCSNDIDPGANKTDCTMGSTWTGGSYELVASDSVDLDAPDMSLVFDVSNDVQLFIDGMATNDGWVIKKAAEGIGGAVSFAAQESGPGATLTLELQ